MRDRDNLQVADNRFERPRKAPAERSCDFLSSLLANKWALLILDEACRGTTKFHMFEERLGVAATSLSRSLAGLVDLRILAKRPYSKNPPRWEYVLTPEGELIRPAIEALAAWVERCSISFTAVR